MRPIYYGNNNFIGLIGCGQFQFSTIAYFLSRSYTNKFLFCYDPKIDQSTSLANFYRIPIVVKELNLEASKLNNKLKLVYIASNHFTHASYSIYFLNNNIDVFSEKPIVTNYDQLNALITSINSSKANFYVGYNRPFSSAIKTIKANVKSKSKDGKFTLGFFINSHLLSQNHWYRNPNEGTRICGNLGHWLDLMIHIYAWRGFIPNKYSISVSYSNFKESDENINVCITTEYGDLTSVTISSRSEPFEGISETLNFQYDSIIAKIDDFKELILVDDNKRIRKSYFPKDVGHKGSINQPFASVQRNLQEVISSTELMLVIAQMTRNLERFKEVNLNLKLK